MNLPRSDNSHSYFLFAKPSEREDSCRSSKAEGYQKVSAATVAKALKERGATSVVINACRSAYTL